MASHEGLSHAPTPDVTDDSPNLHANQSRPTVRMIGPRLYVDGFIYIERSGDSSSNKVEWECRRSRRGGCHAKAVTSKPVSNKTIILYMGPGESKHTHLPSINEVETAMLVAGVKEVEDHKLEPIVRKCSVGGSDLGNTTSNRIELQKSISLSTARKMKLDKLVTKSGSNRPMRSTAGRVIYTSGLDYASSPTPPRLIGNRLNIDDFIYIKVQSYTHGSLPKIRWQCKRYKSGDCTATAITSDPSLCRNLIVYKGPDESNHSHSPSCVEVEEAQELVRRARIETKANLGLETQVCATAITSDPSLGQRMKVHKGPEQSKHYHPPAHSDLGQAEEFANNHSRQKLLESEIGSQADLRVRLIPTIANSPTRQRSRSAEYAEIEDSERSKQIEKQMESNTGDGILQPTGSKMNKIPESPRFIGKRLCVDGYIYVKSCVRYGKINWECKRYRKTGCPAKVCTSDPLSTESIIYRISKKSKHNHPPSLLEVKAAEDYAQYGHKRRLPKLECTVRDRSRSSTRLKEDVQSLSKSNDSSSPVEVVDRSLRRSQRSTASGTKNRLLTRRKRRNTKRNALVSDDRMYRKFLVVFSKRPMFDKQSVVRALKVVYSSLGGRLMAYATVLKNRKKIEDDLEVLRNDPNATILAPNNSPCKNATSSSNESVEVDPNGEATLESKKPNIAAPNAARMEEPTGSSETQKHLPVHETMKADKVPPVPAAISIEDLPSSVTSPPTLAPTLSQNEPQRKQDIVFIDLTDDSDETPIIQEEVASCAEALVHSNQIRDVNIQGNPALFMHNFGSPYNIGAFGFQQQNHLHSQFAMPPNYMYPFNNPLGYSPFINCSMENVHLSNFGVPMNDVQMQWMNFQNGLNNAAINPNQSYTQFQPYYQS